MIPLHWPHQGLCSTLKLPTLFTEPRLWPNWNCLALTCQHISRTRSNILMSECCSCTKAQWRCVRLVKGNILPIWIWLIIWWSLTVLVVSETHIQFLCCSCSVCSTCTLKQFWYGCSEKRFHKLLLRWKYAVAATEIDPGYTRSCSWKV